jgi:hypothetical protein
MNAIEFTTELSGAATLEIPADVAAQLPKAGKARVIVLTEEGTDEAEWRAAAYEQFLRDLLDCFAVQDDGYLGEPRQVLLAQDPL